MGKFGNWFFSFMQGRYGFDELGRSMSVWSVVLIIASVALSVVAGIFHNIFNVYTPAVVVSLLSHAANIIAIVVIVAMCARIFSRNIDKRRSENERYLAYRSKKGSGGRGGSGQHKWMSRNTSRGASGHGQRAAMFNRGAEASGQDGTHSYLACPFCGQRMRVPAGKGKIAVKCPSCNEKTIFVS